MRQHTGLARVMYDDFSASEVPAAVAGERSAASRAVLLVHGGLFDPMDGERFWGRPGITGDLVAAGWRVLVPDRRYATGRTSVRLAAHAWEVEADDLRSVLEAAEVERVHVVTGSNGCSAAARFALENPARVATLTLGWPVSAHAPLFVEAFARSSAFIADQGPAAYLALLRAEGVPRPHEERAGFPYGHALLHDEALAAEFVALTAVEAAGLVRETARAMLPGDPIRGLTPDSARELGALGFGITIVPPAPEDPFHTLAAASALARAIPGARVVEGFPVPPSPHFAQARERFVAWLGEAFACGS